MNDIKTIIQQNALAVARNVNNLVADGCHVVIEYAGLHVMGAESFSGFGAEIRARARLDELNASGNSTHGELRSPDGNVTTGTAGATNPRNPAFLQHHPV
jgi:hypothetical protein